MNLCVYVFIPFAIVNFVYKFGEIHQGSLNLSFIDFGNSLIGCTFGALDWDRLCGKLARFLSRDV